MPGKLQFVEFGRSMRQYHPRERVDQTLNKWVDCSAHPLTQVVLTSLRSRSTN
jgi:hypothetical protein